LSSYTSFNTLFLSPFWFVAVLPVAVLVCRRFGQDNLSPFSCRRFGVSPFWFVAVLTIPPVPHCCKGDVASQWEMAILGVSVLRNPWINRSTKNLTLTHVISSVSWPRIPSFIKIGGTRTSRQYGEMYTSRTFYIFFEGDCLGSSTEKSTQLFQALNGLKCSTVGSLGS